jgi:hypothetical protein
MEKHLLKLGIGDLVGGRHEAPLAQSAAGANREKDVSEGGEDRRDGERGGLRVRREVKLRSVKDDEVNGFSVEQNRPGMPTTGGTRGEQNKQYNTTT